MVLLICCAMIEGVKCFLVDCVLAYSRSSYNIKVVGWTPIAVMIASCICADCAALVQSAGLVHFPTILYNRKKIKVHLVDMGFFFEIRQASG